MGHCEQKCYLVDMYIQLSRITSMIRVFFLPQNYHCPTMNDNYATVAKINQEFNLIIICTYFIPLSIPLIVKLVTHARWWLRFFDCLRCIKMVPSAKNGDSRTKLSYTSIRLQKHTWYRSAIGIQKQHTMIGSFSIDNGEGSEHVTFKMN